MDDGTPRTNIALIGTGFMGGLHARSYASIPLLFPELQRRPVLSLVADVNGAGASAALAQYGFARSTTDWREALGDDIDLVDICAPNDLHEEIAIAALEAGKHVMCEKPMARTLAEADRMAAAADKAPDLVTMVGFNNRFAPALAYASELVRSGAFGQIRHFRASFLSDWAGDPSAALSWRFSKEVAGSGVLGDVGSHMIDAARFLTGEEIDEVLGAMLVTMIPARPVSSGGTFRQQDIEIGELGPVDVDDEFAALFRLSGGGTGVIEGSRVATGHGAELCIQVEGTEGALRFNGERLNEIELWSNAMHVTSRGRTLVSTGPEHPYFGHFSPLAGSGIGFGDTIAIELWALLAAIESGDTRLVPGFADGLVAQMIMERIEQVAAEAPAVSSNAPRS
jgi:predicted dehydrogenase